jgi:hypothetical protein
MPTRKISRRKNSDSIGDGGVLTDCSALTASGAHTKISYVSSKFERIDLK